jgi:hypothetical protein
MHNMALYNGTTSRRIILRHPHRYVNLPLHLLPSIQAISSEFEESGLKSIMKTMLLASATQDDVSKSQSPTPRINKCSFLCPSTIFSPLTTRRRPPPALLSVNHESRCTFLATVLPSLLSSFTVLPSYHTMSYQSPPHKRKHHAPTKQASHKTYI